MDYKEKFEDFLSKMQGLLENAEKQGHIIIRVEDLENAFPELKESEDEKIRKEIIYHIKNCDDTIDEETEKRMLAWLENIPYTIDHEKREGFHLGYKAALEKQNSDVDNANKEYWRGYREGKQEILDKYAELEKQGEQKPAWSDEDEEHYKACLQYFDEVNPDMVYYKDYQWLKSLKQRIGG